MREVTGGVQNRRENRKGANTKRATPCRQKKPATEDLKTPKTVIEWVIFFLCRKLCIAFVKNLYSNLPVSVNPVKSTREEQPLVTEDTFSVR